METIPIHSSSSQWSLKKARSLKLSYTTMVSEAIRYLQVPSLLLSGHWLKYYEDTGIHPIHLHGHTVQLVARTNSTCSNSPIPMRRDTWMEPRWNSSDPNHPSTVVRFQADNPGVWFFHCHMEWHLVAVRMVFFFLSDKSFSHTVKLFVEATYMRKMTDSLLN